MDYVRIFENIMRIVKVKKISDLFNIFFGNLVCYGTWKLVVNVNSKLIFEKYYRFEYFRMFENII